jgi:GGDEF domain-containing protein
VIVLFVASSLTYFFLRRSARFAELAAELETANRTDELTGLLNRKTFLGETRRLVGTRETNGSTGAMLFIDADHFKAINDSFRSCNWRCGPAGNRLCSEIMYS